MIDVVFEKKVLDLMETVLGVPVNDREQWLAEHAESVLLAERVSILLSLEEEAEAAFPDTGLLQFLPEQSPADGTVVGRYRLLKTIGEGGMATVHLAEREDGAFDHQVAVKILRSTMLEKRSLDLFHHERQVLASLQHPAIAHLYDGGTWNDNQPFVVMEYVDGLPVNKYAETVDLRAIVDLLIQVCDGVQAAHDALIIHRDIKPGNILVTAGGQAKILDFGIAKSLSTHKRDVTYSAEMTPRYASPEQLRGERLTTRTDVYSLGVLFYELFSGEAPFKDRDLTPVQLEKQLTTATADAPSARCIANGNVARGQRLRGDLDAIVLKAIDEDPAMRYRNAGELGADLVRFRDGYPVVATPRARSYLLRKWIQRNRSPFALGTFAATALLVGTAVSTWQYQQASSERDKANQVNSLLQDIILSPSKWAGLQGSAIAMPSDVKVIDMWRAVEDSILDRDLGANVSIELLANLAQSYLNVDAWDDTIRVADRVRAIADQANTRSSEYYLRAIQSRTYAMHKSQHVETAEAYRELLAAQSQSDFSDTPEFAEVLRNYGIWLWGTGDLAAAADQIDASIDLLRRLNQPAGLAYSLGNGGLLDCQMGRIDGCVSKLDGAIDIWAEAGQPPIPSFHRAKATAHLYLGELPDAIREAREARRVGGELVPGTLEHLRAVVELARALLEDGQFHEAALMLDEARGIEGQLLDADHPERVSLLLIDARLSSEREEWQVALDSLRRIDAIRPETPYSVHTSALDYAWGVALEGNGDLEGARVRYERAYEFRREFFGENAFLTRAVHARLVSVSSAE
ncbi:MAG TPA: serine/threonine-protein kinase [Woeseiaceae bacterium]|nr:serine/threonine-protein kinase [Woeseiaceae bacterium]